MGVFKEEAHVLEVVEQAAVQIYSDACDAGVPYDDSNIPKNVAEAITAVKRLAQLDAKFPDEKPMIVSRIEYGKGMGVQLIIEIAWEVDEGMECGSRYHINYFKDKAIERMHQGCTRFMSVTSERYRTPYKRK